MIAKTGVLFGKEDARMIERDIGELQDDEVVIKVDVCNLCTTDYQQWMGLRDHQGFPMAGGHENSGTIHKMGKNVVDFDIGDRVALGYDHCGHCSKCRRGLTYECKYNTGPGETEDGYVKFLGFANYQRVKANRVIKLSKDVKPEYGAFLEPLGTVIHGIKKLDLKPGNVVVVIGAGTMGMLNALVARTYGAKVIVSEIQEKQLMRAKEAGFEIIDASKVDPVKRVFELTDKEGADVVIGAVGLTSAYDQAIDMLKKQNGKFLVFSAGYPAPELNVDPNTIHYREIQVIGTMGGNIEDFIDAGEYLSKNIIDVSFSLEGVSFPLKEINKAYAKASEHGMYRVSVNCQEV